MDITRNPIGWRVLATSGLAVPMPIGVTAETVLASVTVPGGARGRNGRLAWSAHWTITSSGNTKTTRARLGGLGGVAVVAINHTSVQSYREERAVVNRGSETAQTVYAPATASSYAATTIASAAIATDTTVDQVFVLTGSRTSAADELTLESWLVEVLYAP